jgi:hypothetical protein
MTAVEAFSINRGEVSCWPLRPASGGVAMRAPRVGDVIAVPVTGAYHQSMSSSYNLVRKIAPAPLTTTGAIA